MVRQGSSAIVVDIDRASIDALGTWPWPRDTMARLVEAVATGRHLDATPARQLQRYSRDLGQRPGASSSRYAPGRSSRAVAGLRLVCATHDAGSATSASRMMLASLMSFEKPGAMSSAVGCKVFSLGILLQRAVVR